MEKYLEWAKQHWKRLAVIAGLCVVVLLAALYHFVWNADPVGDAVRGMFSAVSDDRLDEALDYVDPDSELARYWNSNEDGIRDRTREALAKYKVGFDLELNVLDDPTLHVEQFRIVSLTSGKDLIAEFEKKTRAGQRN